MDEVRYYANHSDLSSRYLLRGSRSLTSNIFSKSGSIIRPRTYWSVQYNKAVTRLIETNVCHVAWSARSLITAFPSLHFFEWKLKGVVMAQAALRHGESVPRGLLKQKTTGSWQLWCAEARHCSDRRKTQRYTVEHLWWQHPLQLWPFEYGFGEKNREWSTIRLQGIVCFLGSAVGRE